MRESDFRALRGWVDYDRPYLGNLTKSQEIRYFSRRVQRTVLRPLRRMCADDRRGWKIESPLLCFGTCICCAIEALGKFQTGQLGKEKNAANFKSFVRGYMDPAWNTNQFASKPYVDHLRDSFRNGLAHGFTIKRGGFERQASYFKVKTVSGIQELEVDPDKLFRDFKRGFTRFIADLRAAKNSDPAYHRFHDAFQGVFVRGD